MEVGHTGKDHFANKTDIKDIEIKDSKGSFLFDQNGKRYIDFTMGWCVGNIGWNNDEIVDAVKNFQGPSYVSPHFKYPRWEELSDLLAEIAPGNLSKTFRATGGTEAVEIALQAAMTYTGRNKFIGIEGAYHGNSIAARGLVSDKSGLFSWKKISPPLNRETADRIEELLKDEDVAALIMEPIVLNLNVVIPDSEFMERMQELCRKYGTLIIMDEVATGFGRTGKLFGSEHFNIAPDIMCLAKAMSGGHAGIGAAVMTEEVADALQEGSFPFSTYGWHPLSVEAAIANIKFIRKNWTSLEENIKNINEYFRQRLQAMNFKSKAEINVMGLAAGLSFEDEDYGEELGSKAFQNGLIIDEGSMFPALNIDFETAKEGLDILESCLRS